LLVSLAVTLALFPAALAEGTGNSLDSAEPWAREGITQALGKGFVPGEIQGSYKSVITRREFCLLAVSWLEYATGKSVDAVLAERGLSRDDAAFGDTRDSHILAAYALGITGGTKAPTADAPGTFTPDGRFTRQEAAVMTRAAWRAAGADVSVCPDAGWTDIAMVGNWARDAVNFCGVNGIMRGTGASSPVFGPTGVYTRQESILVFNQIQPGRQPEAKRVSVSDPSVKGRKIPILMYHAIADVPTTSLTDLFVRPAELEAHLKYLADNGFQTITFEDLDNITSFEKPVMLTFDDGYKDNYDILFPLLKKYNQKATIFVITDTRWSANYISTEEIAEMSASGHVSIQSHTESHPDLTTLGKSALESEMSESKAIIEKITGKDVVAVSYPTGKQNAAVSAAAAEHYRYAVLASGGKFTCGDDTLLMKRIRIDRGLSVKSFAALIS
jgi:peptidoglycan/xylan/chitin deacetylase (PgdA/CDA1 family)